MIKIINKILVGTIIFVLSVCFIAFLLTIQHFAMLQLLKFELSYLSSPDNNLSFVSIIVYCCEFILYLLAVQACGCAIYNLARDTVEELQQIFQYIVRELVSSKESDEQK